MPTIELIGAKSVVSFDVPEAIAADAITHHGVTFVRENSSGLRWREAIVKDSAEFAQMTRDTDRAVREETAAEPTPAEPSVVSEPDSEQPQPATESTTQDGEASQPEAV